MSKKQQLKITDDVLIEQIKAGSQEAFEEIVARYEAKVFSMALRYTRKQEDAEEVLQDVFVTVFRKVGSFEGKSAFSSWLHRIVVNAAFMKLRKNKQSRSVPLEDLSPSLKQEYLERNLSFFPKSDSICAAHELQDALEKAITKLPDEYRVVFVMRDVDGLSNNEVADQLKITIPAVKSRLHRARLMLRKRLKRQWSEYSNTGAESETNDYTAL